MDFYISWEKRYCYTPFYVVYYFFILLFIYTNAIIRCMIVSKRFLPSDLEKRKKIVWKEKTAFPEEITAEMLNQIMKVTDLPQQQVEAVLIKKNNYP